MQISMFPENGEWLLVLNASEPNHDSQEVDATHPANSFDKCWAGDEWTEMPADGQRFESKPDALAYLNEHWQRMENQAAAISDPIPTSFPIRGL
jgi:hypothetical protein